MINPSRPTVGEKTTEDDSQSDLSKGPPSPVEEELDQKFDHDRTSFTKNQSRSQDKRRNSASKGAFSGKRKSQATAAKRSLKNQQLN